MTSLAQYDRARVALAEATRVDEVLSIRDEIEHVKLYAKQIENQSLLIEASQFQMRVERKLGTILSAVKDAGHIRKGTRPKRKGSDAELMPIVTLADIGVDKKLSARAQQRAAMPDADFESSVEAVGERIRSGRAKIIESEPINGARAIMGSRQEPDDSLDFFPTPPWATRALIEQVLGKEIHSVWEPACGAGHMAEVLCEYCDHVTATDIFDYGYGIKHDFLSEHSTISPRDWIITNPPFGDLTEQFVLRAIERAQIGVAMFVRLQWLESVGRYESIFRDHPPTCIAFFAERVPLCKGEWKPEGATATAYIWLVWIKGQHPQAPFWIPPGQRESLTKTDDAARFTQHPVIRRENYNTESDTIAVGAVVLPQSAPEPASAMEAPQVLTDAGSPFHDAPGLNEIAIGCWAERPPNESWVIRP
jgi:hypothetical protein